MNFQKWLILLCHPQGKISRRSFVVSYLVIQVLMIICLTISGKMPDMNQLMDDNASPLQTVKEFQRGAEDTKKVQSYQAVRDDEDDNALLATFFYTITMVLMNYCVLIVSIKRLRDMGKNPWWSILNFVPLINIFFAFHLALSPGMDEKKNSSLE